jgi:hypothetical protein
MFACLLRQFGGLGSKPLLSFLGTTRRCLALAGISVVPAIAIEPTYEVEAVIHKRLAEISTDELGFHSGFQLSVPTAFGLDDDSQTRGR